MFLSIINLLPLIIQCNKAHFIKFLSEGPKAVLALDANLINKKPQMLKRNLQFKRIPKKVVQPNLSDHVLVAAVHEHQLQQVLHQHQQKTHHPHQDHLLQDHLCLIGINIFINKFNYFIILF